MANLWRVFSYEVSRIARRRSFLIITFGLPFLLAVAGNLAQSLMPTGPQMIQQMQQVADRFDGLKKAGFVDFSGLFGVVPEGAPLTAYPDEAAARAALDAGDIEAYYLIPADYAETGTVTQIIPQMSLDVVSRQPVRTLTIAALETALPADIVARFENPTTITQVNLETVLNPPTDDSVSETPATLNRDVDYAVMYGFSLVFLLVVFIGSGYMMQSVIEEKENKLVEILITSVRAEQLLTGKVMAQGVMTLFQVAVWFGISYFLLQTQGDFLRQLIPFLASLVIPWQALPAMGIYLLLGFFLFASAFGAVGALTNSSQEASQYTVFFVLPAMLPYFLIGQFASDPHNPLVVGLSLFPLTAPIAMILRLSLTSVPPLEIVLSVGLLAAAVAGGFWLAGRLFRAQLLMGGKIPGPRAILTALRSG